MEKSFLAIGRETHRNQVGLPTTAMSHKPPPGRSGPRLRGTDPWVCLPFQVVQRLYEDYLEGLLCCVLSSAPSLAKLYSIWEVSTMQRGWAQTGTAPALCTAVSLSQSRRKMV